MSFIPFVLNHLENSQLELQTETSRGGNQFFQEKLEGLHHKTGHLDVPSQCFRQAYVVTNHGVPTRKVKGFSE